MIVLLLCAVCVTACSKKPVVADSAPVEEYPNWPANSLTRPDFVGVVERSVERMANDAESTRYACTVQVPDWTITKTPIRFGTPNGAVVEFHFLPRDTAFAKQDDAQLARLLKGPIKGGPILVVARPWRGWFGEAGAQRAKGNKAIPLRVRVYNLFTKEDQLEIHAEWPTGDNQALSEAQDLVAHIAFSVAKSAT